MIDAYVDLILLSSADFKSFTRIIYCLTIKFFLSFNDVN